MTGVELNTTERTPSTKLEVADVPGVNPSKSVTGGAADKEANPVKVTTTDLNSETLVGLNEIVKFDSARVNAVSMVILESRREWYTGPQTTGLDHNMSADVENRTSSRASTPLRTLPILRPVTVIVKSLPDARVAPPATELLVVRTRFRFFSKETAVERKGTLLLDPSSVADADDEVLKKETGNCIVMLPPARRDVEGTKENVADTPAIPSTRSESEMKNEAELTRVFKLPARVPSVCSSRLDGEPLVPLLVGGREVFPPPWIGTPMTAGANPQNP